MFTQRSSVSISFAGSFPFGGISKDSYRTASINKLPSASLGTMAGPESPPCSNPIRLSTNRPAWSLAVVLL